MSIQDSSCDTDKLLIVDYVTSKCTLKRLAVGLLRPLMGFRGADPGWRKEGRESRKGKGTPHFLR